MNGLPAFAMSWQGEKRTEISTDLKVIDFYSYDSIT
jgi:hypothetical protein